MPTDTVKTAVLTLCAAITGAFWTGPVHSADAGATTVITGVTIIDGNGGAPIKDGIVVVTGDKIAQAGRRGEIKPPRGAKVLDGAGKFVIPGLIDTNVHLDFFFNMEMFPLLVYGDYNAYFQTSPAVEAAQMALKYGVTTILDTYGPILPLIKLRDRIKSGEIVGPRLLVAGHIIGQGSSLSPSETRRSPSELKRWEKDYETWFTQGVGVELTQMYADEVKKAIDNYLDLGPDLIKIAVTSHAGISPITLSFSPRVLKVIVDAAHARGLTTQAHSGSVEGHRAAVDAGIDIITHAGALYSQKLRLDFARELCDSKTNFALFSFVTFPPYKYLREQIGVAYADSPKVPEQTIRMVDAVTPDRNRAPRLPKSLESRLPGAHNPLATFRRENQQTLVDAGCKIVVATDSHPPTYEDVVGYAKSHTDMGIGTVNAIEGLVKQLGMTPSQALVAATKGGAAAAGLISRLGTIEAGKLADMVILDADPLADISNLHKVSRVIHNGRLIDPKTLPVVPKFYKR